jgi:hypothetical protein
VAEGWLATHGPDRLLQVYADLADLYRRKSPSATRAPRLEVGKLLSDMKVPIPSLEMFVVTWNMGNAPPKPQELELLIPMETNHLYDVVIVGMQECDFELTVEMTSAATKFRNRSVTLYHVMLLVLETISVRLCCMIPLYKCIRSRATSSRPEE